MKITTIIENESKGCLKSQRGLSLMVETLDIKYLVDTGADDLVVENLLRSGINPDEIKTIIISHNHNDHIGGLLSILQRNDDARVFISKNAVGQYVKFTETRLETLSDNYALLTMPERFVSVTDMEAICKNVFLCHVANPKPEFKCHDSNLMEIVNGKKMSDAFLHEMYIAVAENGSFNIISPCSHNGILNIIADAKERFKCLSLNAFIGGLHLEGKSEIYATDDDIVALAKLLNDTNLKALYTCHCTGRHAYKILKENCNFPVTYFNTGDHFKI